MKTKILFDELNILETEISSKVEKEEDILDDLLDFFILSYIAGTEDGNEMIGEHFAPSSSQMRETIYKKFNDKDFEDLVTEYSKAKDVESIKRVVETTSHRAYNTAIFNVGAKADKTITKTWETQLDDSVREDHEYLQGQEVPLNSDFYLWDGKHAPYPGGFDDPKEDINCRCFISIHAK